MKFDFCDQTLSLRGVVWARDYASEGLVTIGAQSAVLGLGKPIKLQRLNLACDII